MRSWRNSPVLFRRKSEIEEVSSGILGWPMWEQKAQKRICGPFCWRQADMATKQNKPWTNEDDRRLMEMRAAGRSVRSLAAAGNNKLRKTFEVRFVGGKRTWHTRQPGRYATCPGCLACDVGGLWGTRIAPQGRSRFLLARNVPTKERPLTEGWGREVETRLHARRHIAETPVFHLRSAPRSCRTGGQPRV